MKTGKVIRRIRRASDHPAELEQVARDLGFALARGERDALAQVARALAAAAPEGKSSPEYWAGFAAGMGTLLASYEAAHERVDARQSAMRAASSDSARAVVEVLRDGPATGAELATAIGVSPGAVSKILASLRGAGLVRVLGGGPIPQRGARKPHMLTPLGTWVSDELAGHHRESSFDAVAGTG